MVFLWPVIVSGHRSKINLRQKLWYKKNWLRPRALNLWDRGVQYMVSIKKKQRFSSRLEAEVRWTRAVDRVLVLILEVFPSLTMLQWQSPKEIRSLTILNLVIGKDHRYLWSKHPLLSKNFSYTVLKLWQIYEGIEITMKYFVPHNSVQQVCIFITSN